MTKALTLGLITAGALLMSGCANKVPNYSNSPQNMRAVKNVAASSSAINIGKFTASNEGESKVMCRLATPIGTPDGVTFAKYIEDALSTELEMGNMIDPKSKITITGNLDSLYGSTVLGNAYWEFKVKVTSTNGKSFDVTSRYDYESSFTAYSACSEMQRSYLPAVQELVNKIVTNPQFPELLK
jgi:hypothetical protein